MSQKMAAELKALMNIVQAQQATIEQLKNFANSVREALNSVTALSSCVEKYLDKQDPNWDDGFRQQTMSVMADKKRYRELVQKLGDKENPIEPAELIQIGDEMWAIAGRNGAGAQEAAQISAIYLMARYPAGARRVLRHILDDNGDLLEGVNPKAYEMLTKRCADVEAEIEGGNSEEKPS